MKSLNETLQGLMKNQNVTTSVDQLMKRVLADPDVQAFLQDNQERISREMVQSGQSKLYEFYHEKQLAKKGETTVGPGYSPLIVVFSGQIDVTFLPTHKLV